MIGNQSVDIFFTLEHRIGFPHLRNTMLFLYFEIIWERMLL